MSRLAPLVCLAALAGEAHARPPAPPVAPRFPMTTTIHGVSRRDDYAWLRQRDDPAVMAYLEAEDRHARAVMAPLAAFEETLYREMVGRIQETEVDVPAPLRGYLYYTRTEKGLQYKIHARRKGSLEAPEEVTLDVNELARGKAFMQVGAYEVSDDNHLLAYSTDDVGFWRFTLRVRDLRTGKDLAVEVPRVTSVAWAADGKTLLYSVESEDTKRSHRVYRHVLGQPHERDELVMEEKDERFRLSVTRTRSGAFILLDSASHTTSEVHALRADDPAGKPRLVRARKDGVLYSVDHGGEVFYIVENGAGRNQRLVTAPVASPERWTELVPHREDVMLERISVHADFLLRSEREGALPRLVVQDLRSSAEHTISMPEPVYSVRPWGNFELATTTIRFRYTSFTTPPSIFEYDVRSRERRLLKQEVVASGFDAGAYTSERIQARAGDGTLIPVSLVYRKGLERNGRRPLLLLGYGSYGIPYDVSFDSANLSYLDRGVVVAVAHIRGGGDLGKRWHDAGRMMKKMNTFTDFIAVAEHLVRERITSRDRLVASGGSAGGLLMGAVANLRPDLFKAIVAHVPFVDLINSMLDESLPLTVGEFEEWGNPKIKAEFDAMMAYSPYDNVAARRYPAMLVKTGIQDAAVMYWEPAKWVARLRALKKGASPLLFKVNMTGGHGGSSGRYDKLRERAFDAAFVLWQMGIRK